MESLLLEQERLCQTIQIMKKREADLSRREEAITSVSGLFN